MHGRQHIKFDLMRLAWYILHFVIDLIRIYIAEAPANSM
jgi:hypothetical protein